MLRPLLRSLTASLALIASLGAAQAVTINSVGYANLTGLGSIGFGALGTQILDDVTQIGAAKFGERFAGQSLGQSGFFDTLGNSASGPLTLLSGAKDQNLLIENGQLSGLGWLGRECDPTDPDDFCPGDGLYAEAKGEGAISILFDGDQSEFGFELNFGDQGTVFLAFFDIQGKLLGEQALLNIGSGSSQYGFRALDDNGQALQIIAGVSIWNADPGGVSFSSVRFDVTDPRDPPGGTVPLPSGLLLAGLALAAALHQRRR